MTRILALFLTLGLTLPAPAGAGPELSRRTLRPGSGMDDPKGPVRVGLEEALRASKDKPPPPAPRAGLEEIPLIDVGHYEGPIARGNEFQYYWPRRVAQKGDRWVKVPNRLSFEGIENAVLDRDLERYAGITGDLQQLFPAGGSVEMAQMNLVWVRDAANESGQRLGIEVPYIPGKPLHEVLEPFHYLFGERTTMEMLRNAGEASREALRLFEMAHEALNEVDQRTDGLVDRHAGPVGLLSTLSNFIVPEEYLDKNGQIKLEFYGQTKLVYVDPVSISRIIERRTRAKNRSPAGLEERILRADEPGRWTAEKIDILRGWAKEGKTVTLQLNPLASSPEIPEPYWQATKAGVVSNVTLTGFQDHSDNPRHSYLLAKNLPFPNQTGDTALYLGWIQEVSVIEPEQTASQLRALPAALPVSSSPQIPLFAAGLEEGQATTVAQPPPQADELSPEVPVELKIEPGEGLNGEILVDGRVVGGFEARLEGETVHLDSIFIGDELSSSSPLQGQGIGTAAVRRILEEAMARGADQFESRVKNPRLLRILHGEQLLDPSDTTVTDQDAHPPGPIPLNAFYYKYDVENLPARYNSVDWMVEGRLAPSAGLEERKPGRGVPASDDPEAIRKAADWIREVHNFLPDVTDEILIPFLQGKRGLPESAYLLFQKRATKGTAPITRRIMRRQETARRVLIQAWLSAEHQFFSSGSYGIARYLLPPYDRHEAKRWILRERPDADVEAIFREADALRGMQSLFIIGPYPESDHPARAIAQQLFLAGISLDSMSGLALPALVAQRAGHPDAVLFVDAAKAFREEVWPAGWVADVGRIFRDRGIPVGRISDLAEIGEEGILSALVQLDHRVRSQRPDVKSLAFSSRPEGSSASEPEGLQETVEWNRLGASIASYVEFAMDVHGGAQAVVVHLRTPVGSSDLEFVAHEALRQDWPAQIAEALGRLGVGEAEAPQWQLTVGNYDESNTTKRVFSIRLDPHVSPPAAGLEEGKLEMAAKKMVAAFEEKFATDAALFVQPGAIVNLADYVQALGETLAEISRETGVRGLAQLVPTAALPGALLTRRFKVYVQEEYREVVRGNLQGKSELIVFADSPDEEGINLMIGDAGFNPDAKKRVLASGGIFLQVRSGEEARKITVELLANLQAGGLLRPGSLLVLHRVVGDAGEAILLFA